MNRQYSPEEVSAILKEAAEQTLREPGSTRGGGLTLAELQAIGAESDIDAAAIGRAAARVDAQSLEPAKRRILGINIGAAHAVRLDGPMSDAEFAALVSDCRRVFDARGKVTEQPGYREWRNGNLRVWTEQDPRSGAHLLSMQSMQGMMRSMISAGGVLAAVAIMFAGLGLFGSDSEGFVMAIFTAVIALSLIGFGALSTRSWSSAREEQMQELGDRAVKRQARLARDADETEMQAGVEERAVRITLADDIDSESRDEAANRESSRRDRA